MIKKEFLTLPLADLVPYENNPRHNEEAVESVMESIRQTENLDPIEIDENGVILSGHTRKKALQELGFSETQVVRISGLTEEQKRKYRLLANKTNEISEWDFEKLREELEDLDFNGFDFGWDLPETEEKDPETFTEDGAAVLDVFGGSGSTLIACEQTGRKCFMAELSREYIDVIVKRYVNFKESSDGVYLLRNGEKIPYDSAFLTE